MALPALLVVAGFAPGPVAALVRVVLPVTGKAVARRFLVGLLVAGRALGARMLAHEGKPRLAVVEAGLLPRAFGVALGAAGTELTLVGVVLAVAFDAGARRFAPALARLVAALAIDSGAMRAVEGEVRPAVVEPRLVEGRDLRLPSLVLRVAGPAFLALRLRRAAVIAALRARVRGHVLVAVLAQARLRRLLEALVAAFALHLELRVPLDHLAGHDDRLEHLPVGQARRGDHGRGEGAPGPGDCRRRAHQYMCTASTW